MYVAPHRVNNPTVASITATCPVQASTFPNWLYCTVNGFYFFSSVSQIVRLPLGQNYFLVFESVTLFWISLSL